MTGTSVDLGLAAPLAGESTVGRDLTYEPSFQALQAELDKGTALTGDSVDWGRVQEECVRLLRDETKDLRCVSWLALAMAHLEGWSGTARALAIYHAIVEAHWDAMYPPAKRTRARVAIIEWVWEGLRQTLSPREVTADDGDDVRAILQELRGLEEVLASKLGELNPGAGQLRSVLRDKSASVSEVAPPPHGRVVEPPAATIESKPNVPTGASAPPPPPTPVLAVEVVSAPFSKAEFADIASPVDSGRLTSGWRDGLFSLAATERATDPAAPRAYRFARIGAWLLIESPPDVEGTRTFVRPPRPSDVRELRALFERGDWASLRDAAEDSLIQHIFWLDLHRFTSLALERLGPAFAKARMAVVSETVAFLDRVPNLESLSFNDGTPFADADTLVWLHAERSGRAPSSSRVEAELAEGPLPALLSSARTRCAEGRENEAISDALTQAGALASTRLRFLARLGVAKLAVDGGRKQVGVAILEQLLVEIDETLEAWEPELCASVIRDFLWVSAHREGESERHVTERQDLLFRRLLRLNPASALHLGR